MSEITIQNLCSKSTDGRIEKELARVTATVSAPQGLYVREFMLTAATPVLNIDGVFQYLRVDCDENVATIIGDKIFVVSYLEMILADAQSLSFKYMGQGKASVKIVAGA